MVVTGLTGFKGQWLGRWLSQLGAKVSGFGLQEHTNPLGQAAKTVDCFDCEYLDIRDQRAVEAFFDRHRPELVFHLAAQPLVRQSYKDPTETFATNVMGTVHVLQAACSLPSVRAVVNVTSDKCYENREWHWPYRENEALGGYDPYSASKGCSEIVTAAYRQSFASKDARLKIASARAGNVIGGADWSADRLVPDLVRAIISETPVVLRNPGSIRPWQHVLEAISGYLLLGANLLSGENRFASAYNFGPSDSQEVTVGQLAHRFVDRWGKGSVVEQPDPSAPHEARYLRLDSSKARSELNWQPLLSMEERLDWSIDWYRDWLAKPDQYWTLMDNQIEAIQARCQRWLSPSLL